MAEAAYAFVVYVVSSGPCERLFSCEVDGRQSYLLWIRVGERVLCLQRIELRLEAGAVYVYTSFSGEVAGFLRRLALRNLYLLDDSLGAALERGWGPRRGTTIVGCQRELRPLSRFRSWLPSVTSSI